MGYLVPNSSTILFEKLKLMYDNKEHVKSVKMNMPDACIEVDLDWTANNLGGVADFKIPIKRPFIAEARDFVAVLKGNFDKGMAPTETQAARLYEFIDVTRH